MCGSAFWMVSPSISSTSRSTPCAAGCCGPKLSVRFLISGTVRSRYTRHRRTFPWRMIVQHRVIAVVVADHTRHQRARLDADRLVDHALELRVISHFDIADEREILAERMTDETIVGQNAAQIRMAAKQNAEQIEGLALEPLGAGPHAGQRIDHRILDVLSPDAQPQPLV